MYMFFNSVVFILHRWQGSWVKSAPVITRRLLSPIQACGNGRCQRRRWRLTSHTQAHYLVRPQLSDSGDYLTITRLLFSPRFTFSFRSLLVSSGLHWCHLSLLISSVFIWTSLVAHCSPLVSLDSLCLSGSPLVSPGVIRSLLLRFPGLI